LKILDLYYQSVEVGLGEYGNRSNAKNDRIEQKINPATRRFFNKIDNMMMVDNGEAIREDKKSWYYI